MRRFRPIISAYLILTIANILDLITTQIAMATGATEMNIFARDSLHHAIIFRLIILKVLYTCLFALCSLTLYEVFSGTILAILLAACLPAYNAYQLFQVSLDNVLVALRWFTP
jgi:hypothetical protein